MRILLTGVTGYLGSYIANALIKNGHQVIGIKRKSSSLQRIENIISELILYNIEDIDLLVMFRMHCKIDAVIHTATCYGRNGESSNEILSANLIFPLKLLNATVHSNVALFLNTDTALEKYLNPYALSKAQFSEWGRYFARQKQIRFLNLKLEYFFGPNEDKSNFTQYVINCCLDNIPLLKLTSGLQKRDFIYIDDVVSVYLLLLEKRDLFNDNFIEYEVGSGAAITIRQFVELIHRLTASKTHLGFGDLPYRIGEVMYSQAQTDKLKSLGWSCCSEIETNLKTVIERYLD